MSGGVEVEKLKGELNAAHQPHKPEVKMLNRNSQEQVRRVGSLTADREHIRKDRGSIKGRLSIEVERLKQRDAKETEQLREKLEKANLDRTAARLELQTLKSSLGTHAPKLDASLREIEALRRELFKTKNMAVELQQHLDVQSKELFSAREELSALKTLLDDRTSELKGAQSFLTTADVFSGAEVISALQNLNSEVLQTSAFMAESVVELFFNETTTQVSKTDEQSAACKRASSAIGGAIVHFLGTIKHTDNPILIQIAFQACLMRHLRWVARAWVIGGDESHNRFIDAIYQSMHEKEAQAIAGRWRALTRAHVPPTPLDNSQIVFKITEKIISGLSDILLTAGSIVSKSAITSTLLSKFADKLNLLVFSGVHANKIIGEDVTSGDLEVMAIGPATAFDATTMEDSYNDGRTAKTGEAVSRVLCATDLGLRKRTRVGTTGEKQWEIKVLLKPQVALESLLDNLNEQATCA